VKHYRKFELPSGGNLYPMKDGEVCNLLGLEELERTEPTEWQDTLVAGMIQKSLRDQTMIVRNLCVPDFLYLVTEATIATYGSKFEYPTICPYCNEVHRYKDLTELKVIPFDKETFAKYQTGRIPAPDKHDIFDNSGDEVTLKPLSVTENERVQMKAKVDMVDATNYEIAYSISEINGEKKNEIERLNYAMGLSSAARRVIVSRKDRLASFGITRFQEWTCDKCQKKASYTFSYKRFAFLFPSII
jgi:hypothetical protein